MLRQQLQKYQHQQRLLFSTSRKRRRKPPKLPSTTKDRLRRVTIRPNQNKFIDGDLVTERMQTRLDWVRSNIESLWKDPNVATRPERYEVAMDGNWWKWNILLALAPGVLIATYCEFVAKPKMLENRKDGHSGIPPPSSTSFLEELYDGLIHYLYGMEPTMENKQIQPHDGIANTGSKSHPQESDFRQLQELKGQIRELEERMKSQRPRPGIRERHRVTSPRPETPSDSTASSSTGDSSISTTAGWILQTLTESLESVQEAVVSLVFPLPETQENETSTLVDSEIVPTEAIVNLEATDEHDGSKPPSSSSTIETQESKEKAEDSIVKDESKSRRWWQLWK